MAYYVFHLFLSASFLSFVDFKNEYILRYDRSCLFGNGVGEFARSREVVVGLCGDCVFISKQEGYLFYVLCFVVERAQGPGKVRKKRFHPIIISAVPAGLADRVNHIIFP